MVFRRLPCALGLTCLLLLSLFLASSSVTGQTSSVSGEPASETVSGTAVQAEHPTEISKIGKKLKQAFPDDSALAKALLKEAKREKSDALITNDAVSYTHLTLPTEA